MNEHLAELGVDVWVSWQALPGAAPTDLEDFIEEDNQGSDNSSSPLSGEVTKVLVHSSSKSLIQSASARDNSVSPAASIAAASGLALESAKKEVSNDGVVERQDQIEGDNADAIASDFSGSFIFFVSDTGIVVADGVESHLFDQVISLLRSIVGLLPNHRFESGRVFQFNWPPFTVGKLPGQDDQSAVGALVSMYGDIAGTESKSLVYFGNRLPSYLKLEKMMPAEKRLTFGEDAASGWLLLPALTDMLVSADAKRQAWQRICTRYFKTKISEK